MYNTFATLDPEEEAIQSQRNEDGPRSGITQTPPILYKLYYKQPVGGS